jgi:predicted RNase H-like HicB family nuclease
MCPFPKILFFRNEGRELPKNIRKNGKGFTVKVSEKCYGTYKTVEEALEKLKQVLEQREKEREEKIRNIPIKRNQEEIPIIELFNKNGEKVEETMVDEDKYYDLIRYNWYLRDDRYVQGVVEGETIRMSRYVINYYGDDQVDHINNNPLDNRLINLKISTPIENMSHLRKSKNNTSGHTGVCRFNGDKWRARMFVSGKEKSKTFKTYEEAVEQREEWELERRAEILKARQKN